MEKSLLNTLRKQRNLYIIFIEPILNRQQRNLLFQWNYYITLYREHPKTEPPLPALPTEGAGILFSA